MIREWNLDLPAIRQQGSRRFEPDQRLFWERLACFTGVVGIVESDGDDLRGGNRRKGSHPFKFRRFALEGWRAENITANAVDFPIQNSETQWARAKSFDTFTPLGPHVETKLDPHGLAIQLFQNGQLRQNSNTSQLIFDPYKLVSFISTNLTLLPGDIILTGTPSGIGPIKSGDKLEVRISGLSPLVNTVK
jgi:hypothetical protein